MPTLVDLTAAPYNLKPDQVGWVEQTLAGMSEEEKVGQLFVNLFHFGVDEFSGNALSSAEILDKFHIGAARYHGGNSEKVQGLLNELQAKTRIPLLIAANCDSGGNGACSDGTYIASGAQAEAAGDESVAYNAGLVSAREMTALGVNLNFDPCVDILYNWRNTIVNTRAYGTDADTVLKHTRAYLRGGEVQLTRLADRQPWDAWEAGGRQGMADRAHAEAIRLLRDHTVPPLDDYQERTLDQIMISL